MDIMQIALKIGTSLLIIFIGFLLGKMVRSAIIRLAKTANDKGAMTFLGSICNLAIKGMGVIMALQHLGVEMSVIVGAFSAMGLGISLALQKNMANVAGGIQLILTHPFKVGDYILLGDHEGRVIRIETMFTTLLTPSNQEVIIPNSDCVSQVVMNYTAKENRRIHINIPVSLETDVDAFTEEILSLVKKDTRIVKNPAPVCVMTEFMANGKGIQIGLYCYTAFDLYWNVLYDLNKEIQKKRLEMKVSSPYESLQIKSNEEI